MLFPQNRRSFLGTCASLIFVPNLFATAEGLEDDRDLSRISAEIPLAAGHLERLQAACQKYANIYPLGVSLPAKILAIESGFNPDAISDSFAVGAAQLMHTTARDLGAKLPAAATFSDQEQTAVLRRQAQTKMNEAIAAFRKGEDKRAKALRIEARHLSEKSSARHKAVMSDFKKHMFDLSTEARREYDQRFDPAVADDMVVHFLARLARMIKKDLGVEEDLYVQLLAGVAYNAGPGRVKRKPGIPVVGQAVEYANKLMLFHKVRF